MKRRARFVAVTAVAIVYVLLTTTVSAQPLWVNQGQKPVFSFEFVKPNLDGTDNTTSISSAVFFTLRWPWTEKIIFVGELALAHAELDFEDFDSDADNKLGNPYLGLEFFREPSSSVYVELGIRAPVVSSSNFATFIGFFADVDRFEAFRPDVLPLLAVINLRQKFPTDFFIRLRAGTSIELDTGNDNDESELYIIFAGLGGYEHERLRLEVGLTGRLIVTEDGNIGERTFLQMGANASYAFGVFRPGIHFRLPLDDDLKEVIDYVVGFNLEFQLRQ